MSEADSLVIRCQCGAKLRVPAAAAGKKVKCPKCEFKMIVPAAGAGGAVVSATSGSAVTGAGVGVGEKPQAAAGATKPRLAGGPGGPRSTGGPRAASGTTSPAGESDSLLDDLLSLEQSAAAASTSSVAQRQTTCPQCRTPVALDARTCAACGYDLAGAQAAKAKKGKAAVDRKVKAAGLAKAGGRFALGCGLSGVGAIVAAGIWIAVAAITGYESGWIAWAVGLATGFGMVLGYGKQNVRAGVVAALMSLFGIFVAKIGVFAFVIYVVLTGNTNDIDLQREYVKYQMAEAAALERGVDSADPKDEEAWDAIVEEVEGQVTAMNEVDVRRRWKELREAEGLATDEEALDVDERHYTVAYHRSDRKADELGLPPWSKKRDQMYEQELAAATGMPDADLDAAVAEIERWDEGACWDDAKYVRTFLIYHHASEASDAADEAADEDADWDEAKAEREWRTRYAAAMAKVDALSAEEQRTQAKALQDEQARALEEMRAKLAEAAGGAEGVAESLAIGTLIVAFVVSVFGLFDILFILLAVFTAYRVGSGGGNA